MIDLESTGFEVACQLLQARPLDAHKGTMGHAVLIAGSYGMMGASMLAARACLRSGVGKLTCFVEPSTYPLVQTSVPEAVYLILERKDMKDALVSGHYKAIGIGPGLGQHPTHWNTIQSIGLLEVPTVLDADALNHLALHKSDQWPLLSSKTIITPHLGEYRRLFGNQADPIEMARVHGLYIVQKGPNTKIYTPTGRVFVNQSGNPGMATAGSGDVLTGILTGLLARGYPVEDAARLGVFLHGLAGDLAAREIGQESLMASDIIDQLPAAFLCLQTGRFKGSGL